MKLIPLVLTLLTVGLSSGGCSIFNQSTAERRMDVQFAAVSVLEVQSFNGGITVQVDPSATELRVEAKVRAGGGSLEEASRRAEQVEISISDGEMGGQRVEPVFPGVRRMGDGCSLAIVTPPISHLKIYTSNGSIGLDSVSCEADVRTSNGPVTINGQEGPLTVKTSNGRVEVLRMNDAPADVHTSNGSIRFEVESGTSQPFNLHTSNGSVRILLPNSPGGSIHARTSNGSIHLKGAASERQGEEKDCTFVFDQPGPASEVRTSNGSIVIEVPQ